MVLGVAAGPAAAPAHCVLGLCRLRVNGRPGSASPAAHLTSNKAMPLKVRLILDEAHSATFNMAADEVLMESQRNFQTIPVLRMYFWSVPSISIGYFQNVQEVARRLGGKGSGGIVRRITGGGLVGHGDDLTFSLILKNNNPFLPTDVKMSYLKVSEALRLGLKDLYPELDYADCKTAPSGRGGGERVCFEQLSCYDLLIGKKKVVGASQRRKDGVILHQSTVFLRDAKEILTEKILKGFRNLWKIDLEPQGFTTKEIERIRKKEKERYGSPEWAAPVI